MSGLGILRRLVKSIASSQELQQKGLSIHLWEQRDVDGGPAWSDANSEVQLFNLPAGVAALEAHDFTGPFLKWCAANGHTNYHFGSYPPRRLFGLYCQEFLKETIELARENNIIVEVHTFSQVVDIQKENDHSKFAVSWKKISSTEDHLNETVVDAVVLCTGPASLENDALSHLRGRPGYLATPWPHPEIPRDSSVAVIGTGLSAVDVVKQLYAGGHEGAVIMASRGGMLPTIKAQRFEPFLPLTVATPEAVEKVVEERGVASPGLLEVFAEMLKKEFEAFQAGAEEDSAVMSDISACFDETLHPTAPHDGLRALELGLAASRTGKRVPWQDCTIALTIRDVIRLMWSKLSAEEKNLFLARHCTALNVHLNAMPSSSGEDLLGYFRDRECHLRGALAKVTAAKSGFDLHFASEGDSSRHVDCVINAAGFGKSFTGSAPLAGLFASLLQSGLAQPCDQGGLLCDYKTCRLIAKGVRGEDNLLYATGHVISGTKLLTSGIGYCLTDGVSVVDDILKRL